MRLLTSTWSPHQEPVCQLLSSSFFIKNDGSYERISCAGDDKYSVLRHPMRFDANVDPRFEVVGAVGEDKQQQLSNKDKLWFDKTVTGRDNDKQIIDGAVHSDDSTKQHTTR